MSSMLDSLGLPGNSALLVVAVVMLFYGAEWLVRGGSNLARIFGVKPMVVGLTIVAFGTSMPEFVVSLIANVWKDSASIAIGNIIGSNITNIGLILGLSGLIFPIVIHFSIIYKQLVILFLCGILLYAFSLNGMVGRWEGLVLTLALLGYIYYLYRHPDEAPQEDLGDEVGGVVPNALFVLLGSTALSTGAWLFVESAVWIAEEFQVPKLIIGLTIVAMGTSLPELATSLVAAFRKQNEISVGNIVGSNIFNILFIMGGVGLIKPLSVLETRMVDGVAVEYFPHTQYILMLLFGLILIPLGLRHRIGRLTGTILVSGYVGFYVYLFLRFGQ